MCIRDRDYLIKKLIEYFDDSFVIYRNRPIFGAQFDVCLLAPKIGIIIFEVKAWKPDTIKEVKNGDSILIKTKDEMCIRDRCAAGCSGHRVARPRQRGSPASLCRRA